MKEKIVIEKEQAGKRVDKALVDLKVISGFSRADFARAIKSGGILVNDKKIKPGYVLKEGDEVRIKNQELRIKNQNNINANFNVKLDVICEDENIIVINKPAGLKIHLDNFEDEADTLVGGLLAKFPEIDGVGDDSIGAKLRPGIVHRLDKDTSGVIVTARNQKTFDELKDKFKNRQIQKVYQAIVFGILEKKEGIINASIARSSTYRKQVIAGRKTKTKVRTAVTEFRVIREFGGVGDIGGASYSLVEARPKTGRMHQIRVHLFSIGHPIVGDRLYKKKEFSVDKFPRVDRQLLHAKEIEFELFEKKYDFSVPLPKDFERFLDSQE
jgi:23S rRNA pseudouridine1911/1915/1917 synthase